MELDHTAQTSGTLVPKNISCAGRRYRDVLVTVYEA